MFIKNYYFICLLFTNNNDYYYLLAMMGSFLFIAFVRWFGAFLIDFISKKRNISKEKQNELKNRFNDVLDDVNEKVQDKIIDSFQDKELGDNNEMEKRS